MCSTVVSILSMFHLPHLSTMTQSFTPPLRTKGTLRRTFSTRLTKQTVGYNCHFLLFCTLCCLLEFEYCARFVRYFCYSVQHMQTYFYISITKKYFSVIWNDFIKQQYLSLIIFKLGGLPFSGHGFKYRLRPLWLNGPTLHGTIQCRTVVLIHNAPYIYCVYFVMN